MSFDKLKKLSPTIYFYFLRTALIFLSALWLLPDGETAHAQESDDFFTRAIRLAQLSQRETSVPASVTLAQAVWETGRGRSPIGEANNYFGIKAALTPDGVNVGPIATGWVWADTKEWNGTRYVERRERFRKYQSMEDSFRDHGVLLATSPRYADAMRAVDDPREFARRIAAAGYATSPTYPNDLIALMEREDLYQYDVPRNDAQLLGQSQELSVNAGEIFQIYFDVKNTGFGTWTPSANYYLVSANENRFSADARQPLDQLVPPEHVQRWAMTMIAPRNAGKYRSVWVLKHGEQNFGPELSIEVQVRAVEGIAVWQIFAGALLLGGLALGGSALYLGHTRKK